MTTPLQLTIQVDGAPPEEVASITRELNAWLTSNVPEVRTSLPAVAPARPGDKGLELAIGTLVLALINSGAAVALVNCLTTYIKERRRSVQLEIKNAAGRAIALNADNIGRDELPELLRQLNQLAGDGAPATAS